MDQLVKIDKDAMEPLSKVLITFMDKMEKVAGWVAIPKGKKADQEEAIRFYIKELEKREDMPALMKAALITQARKTLKEYCNTNDIVNIAINYMNESSKPEKLDEDWLSYFYERAKNINRDDVKIIWGKILATECNKGGYIPKQLMNILLLMDKQDAELFNRLCQFTVNRQKSKLEQEKNLLIFFDDDTDFLKKYNINLENAYELESLGLIKIITDGIGVVGDEQTSAFSFSYHNTLVEIQNKSLIFLLGNVAFTRIGARLAEMIDTEKNDEFLNYVCQYYEQSGHVVTFS